MTQPSRITDEMRKSIGVTTGIRTVEVDEKWIARFAEVLEDSNPLWTDEESAKTGPYGGIIAPPSFIYGFHISGKPQGGGGQVRRFTVPSQPIDAGGDWEFFEPVRPGDVITLTTKIADIYERPGSSGTLLFIINELDFRNQKGQFVARYHMTHIYR